MASKKSNARRRVGRPPAGAREGEKVKDYPQLSIRLPAEVKAKLHAISVVTNLSQWRLVSEAIDCYLRARPDSERAMVEDLVGRARSRAGQRRLR
jgi:hypothetical protein